MKSGTLSSALEAACREQLPQGRYPSCVLHLTMPFEMVDVNVHPNKLECRFQNDFAIAEAIEAIIRDAFVDRNPLEKPQVMQLAPESTAHIAPVSVKKQESVAIPAKAETGGIKEAAPKTIPVTATEGRFANVPKPAIPAQAVPADFSDERKQVVKTVVPPPVPVKPVVPVKPMQPVSRPKPAILHESSAAVQTFMQSYQQSPVVKAAPTPMPEKAMQAATENFLPESPKPLKLIGTAFNSYILVEYEDNLLLIDQQGVHERLLFDRMMKSLDTSNCSQELLIPLIVPATRREQQLLETHQELLRAIGLTVESFGETEVSIRSIPMILGQPQAGDLLREIIDQLEGERGVISLEKRRAGILALACKKAVRSGERLNESDLRELVVRMVEKKITPTSPRGTPLIVALTHSDIDRRFRRFQ